MAGPWPCIVLKTAPASSFPWRSWSLQSLSMATSSHYPATLGCGKTSLLPNLHSQFQKWGFNKDPHTHTPTIENSILPTNCELNDKLLKWHIHFLPQSLLLNQPINESIPINNIFDSATPLPTTFRGFSKQYIYNYITIFTMESLGCIM